MTAEKLLHQYLDKVISAKDREAFETHLAVCLRCRQAMAQMEQTFHLLENMGEVAIPSGFLDGVMARVRDGPLNHLTPSPSQALFRLSAQAAFYSLVTLVAFLGLFLVFQSSGGLKDALTYVVAPSTDASMYEGDLLAGAPVAEVGSLVTFLDSILVAAGSAEPGLILGASFLFLAGCLVLAQLINRRVTHLPGVGAQWAG